MLTNELLNYLFDGKPHLIYEPMAAWLGNSRRFTAFVTDFRDKIRKKLRVTRDPETLLDLRLEFETAYLLLQERTLSVAYEPEQSKQVRSPDFAVTYTTSLAFMVEVTRLRTVSKPELSSPTNGVSLEGERLPDAICSKLGQLLPRRGNVLVVGVDTLRLTQTDLQSIILRIQKRAERSDSAFWARYGFPDRAEFFRHYHRLSEVIVRGLERQADQSLVSWVNSQAKHPLPGKVRAALYRGLTQTAG